METLGKFELANTTLGPTDVHKGTGGGVKRGGGVVGILLFLCLEKEGK